MSEEKLDLILGRLEIVESVLGDIVARVVTLTERVGNLERKVDGLMTEQRETNEDFRRSIEAIRNGVGRLEQQQANRGGHALPASVRPHG